MLVQFLRYNAVGIANTMVGFGIIFLLMYFGMSATLSNMLGYAIGAIFSYILNSQYTFQDNGKNVKQALSFFGVLMIAYVCNLLALQYFLSMVNPYLSQVGAAFVYTVSAFFLSRYFVFKHKDM